MTATDRVASYLSGTDTLIGELHGPTLWRGGFSHLLFTAAFSSTALSRTTARSGPPTERDLPDIHRLRCSPITWQGRSLIFCPGIFIGPRDPLVLSQRCPTYSFTTPQPDTEKCTDAA